MPHRTRSNVPFRRRAPFSEDEPIPAWARIGLIGGAFTLLLALECIRPLRRRTESKPRRNARNFAVAGLSAAAIHLAETPVAARLSQRVVRRRQGALFLLPIPPAARTALAVILMDYTLYLWHVLTHRVPFLWRFHRVHHADLDLDASTAIRFHFGEMILSVAWRALQIRSIGVGPRALSLWQTLLLMEILFHHSNLRLPLAWERRLARWIVTPRLHGIHHSTRPDEVNSNWSSGLTVWDRLHGTLRVNVPQDKIEIGAQGLRDPAQVTLPRLVVLPFSREGNDPQRQGPLQSSRPGAISTAQLTE